MSTDPNPSTLEHDPTAMPLAVGGQPREQSALSGNMGTWGLAFTTLAYNAPIAIVTGYVTVVVAYGNGVGAPWTYVVVAVIALLFAVGFTAFARHLPRPGGFYALITAGLGKHLGLGVGYLATAQYFAICAGGLSFLGFATASLVSSWGGPPAPWWVYSIVFLIFFGVLGYVRLELSTRLLTVFLIAEVILVVVYDVVVLSQGGESGLTSAPFLAENIFSGSIGLALLFGMLSLSGFEASVIFREEVKDPDKTIPRAVYMQIIVIGVLYTVSAYAFIVALGPDNVVAAAQANPLGAFLDSAEMYLGVIGRDLFNILTVTSLFAGLLAGYNTISRYLYNLGHDGILPRALASVHAVQRSPHRASIVTGVILLGTQVLLAFFGGAAEFIYPQVSGAGGYALLVMLALVTIAAIVFLNRTRPEGVTAWHRLIAPILALVGLSISIVLATINIDQMITAGPIVVAICLGVVYGLVVLGIIMASVYKRKRPDVYARIGRE
ncbi:APC family permease [Microbacterium atlanticum]|uniref:APC family permease n=1 Tax=Microbacterium atlanticum TaxID=2782168 RepID=UPI001886FE2C|nr:APC family permease [Microbacterium atlanticum]